MGRSKNLHFVQHDVLITQSDDPDANWAEGVIQVDQILSKELGRTIRNGNSFRLVGYGSQLKGFTGAGDLDIGFAGVTAVQFCPVTKNGVGAWQSLQKQWMQQKRLSSSVGKYVRYDDFEVGWDDSELLHVTRNSTILMEGLTDTASESVGLYGPSAAGTYVSLEEYYDNLNPIAAPSLDYVGAIIKQPKFSNKFPDRKQLISSTSFTSQSETSTIPDNYHGGLATGIIDWLPSDNHLSHMTGTLFFYFKGVSYHDTTVPPTIPDELKLTITLVYEGWAPLAKVRSAKGTKKLSTTAPRTKSTTHSRRRS